MRDFKFLIKEVKEFKEKEGINNKPFREWYYLIRDYKIPLSNKELYKQMFKTDKELLEEFGPGYYIIKSSYIVIDGMKSHIENWLEYVVDMFDLKIEKKRGYLDFNNNNFLKQAIRGK